MNIINTTPHEIVLDNGTQKKVYPKSDTMVRVVVERVPHEYKIDGFDLIDRLVTKHNLPEPLPDTYLIVSMQVKNEFPNRQDLIVPDSINALRNKNGKVISVPGFIR